MKFLSKNSMKKTAIILVFLTLFSFAVPNYSNAGLIDTLVNPVKSLVVFIADGIMSILQGSILGDWDVTKTTTSGTLACIKYNPEKIFNNEIALFDVNFFEKKEVSSEVPGKAQIRVYNQMMDSPVSKEQWEQFAESAQRLLARDYTSIEEFKQLATNLNVGVSIYSNMVGINRRRNY